METNTCNVPALRPWVACLLAALIGLAVTPVGAKDTAEAKSKAKSKIKSSKVRVVPPQVNYRGLSYGEWSAQWWKWCFRLPADHHPLFNTADCSAGQSGNVWFLGGTFTLLEGNDGVLVGKAERSCTVPADTALFFPILNSECATIEGNGDLEEDLRGCVTKFGTAAVQPGSDLRCVIDGKSVGDLSAHRVQSPLFTYGPLPENSILDELGLPVATGATSLSVSDGVYVMLEPLAPGKHTIHFSGNGIFTAEEHGFDYLFRQEISYHITVLPKH